jgi:hypothetical protein
LGDAVARLPDDRQKDLLRPALEEIIDLGHPLVRLPARSIGGFSAGALPACARRVRVSPGLPTRLVAGLRRGNNGENTNAVKNPTPTDHGSWGLGFDSSRARQNFNNS